MPNDTPSPEPADTAAPRPAFARWLGTTNDVTRRFLAAGRIPGLINIAGGLPAPEIYAAAEVAELARRAIEQHPQETLGYGPIEGLPELREALAARFATPELRLGRENVLVTTSGMQGLDLIGKVLLEEGGLIAGQFPTYLGALDAWRPRRPTYRNLILEEPRFDPVAAMAGAQFTYTVPNFSNPTGRLVGLPMRQAFVDAAHRTGVWLVEDDPYGALHYDGAPLPRLLELSGRSQRGRRYDGPVLYMGTLSKEIAPGLRIGWVIGAPAYDRGPDHGQAGLRHVHQRRHPAHRAGGAGKRPGRAPAADDRRSLPRAPRRALRRLGGTPRRAGSTGRCRSAACSCGPSARDPSLDTDRLFQAALEAGVCVTPSSVFDPAGRNRRALRLNFTLNPPDRLAEGVRRLAAAARSLAPEA